MGELLPAIAPAAAPNTSHFPYPSVVQTSGPGQEAITFEGPTIIGIPMPGQWLLTKCQRTFGWQKQLANFLSGGTVVPTGDPPADIEYEVRIWESGAMGIFRKLLQTTLKKPAVSINSGLPASAALGIDDPALKDLGITKVVVAFIDYPKNPLVSSGGKGPWIGKVGFIEFRRPIAASPVPNQDIPDPGAVTPSAASNLATAQATVTQGAANLQGAAAQRFVPPR